MTTFQIPPGADSTPLMKQYWELKSQVPDAILFFRMGDFYEVFADDAIEANQLLEITLTSRDKGKENPMAMAGVPHHSVQGYIQKLLDAGRKVAIGEQVEDPEEAKKRGGSKAIVRREVVRVFTPAVQFDTEGSETAYLATALPLADDARAGAKTPARLTLACLDPSTGETRLSLPLDERALAEELQSLPIRHFLRVGHRLPEACVAAIGARPEILLEEVPDNRLGREAAFALVAEQFAVASLEAYLESGADLETSTRALGLLVHYLGKSLAGPSTEPATGAKRLSHVRLPHPLRASRALKLGPRSAQHLDLLPATETAGAHSLFGRVNRTKSAMGARRLKRWILEPLRTVQEISARQESVRELSGDVRANDQLQAALGELYDLERILGRVNAGLASPRDTRALGRSLAVLSQLPAALARFGAATTVDLRDRIRVAEEELRDLSAEILRTQLEDAPLVSRDGGIFAKGTDPELDRLIALSEDGSRWLVELEAREREATGIASLKVRYNRVFGYYIEVTSANLKSVPSRYQRKQTTVGGERFFTEELKRFEDEIVTAGDKRRALESELFKRLLGSIQSRARAISDAAAALAELDALVSLARLGWETGWTMPSIDPTLDLEIEGGRHPLVDQGRGTFVPNSLRLGSPTASTLLITGPNMGGKSTILRQTALIVILGQMGAYVPAARARWGVVSSIHTRIGAQDAIMRGQSTFMVEMTELAHILHHADSRSLVVLDEIGRGTSTYDGISVAWSAIEWIVSQLGCRTLFATHYHELTRLPSFLPGVANGHMAVENVGPSSRSSARGGLRFLYELRTGPANESFGIQVAKLAGLPAPVVARAWKVLAELESGANGSLQPSLFDPAPPSAPVEETADEDALDRGIATGLLTRLRAIDPDALTPKQALDLMFSLRQSVAEISS